LLFHRFFSFSFLTGEDSLSRLPVNLAAKLGKTFQTYAKLSQQMAVKMQKKLFWHALCYSVCGIKPTTTE
jgi:hypothetical protein